MTYRNEKALFNAKWVDAHFSDQAKALAVALASAHGHLWASVMTGNEGTLFEEMTEAAIAANVNSTVEGIEAPDLNHGGLHAHETCTGGTSWTVSPEGRSVVKVNLDGSRGIQIITQGGEIYINLPDRGGEITPYKAQRALDIIKTLEVAGCSLNVGTQVSEFTADAVNSLREIATISK